MFNLLKISHNSRLFFSQKKLFATPKTTVKTILITGQSENPLSVKAVFDSHKKTVDVSNPLELLLYSLISCENATLRMIAKEKNIKVGTMNFKKVVAHYDTKGFYGLDPFNKFSKIELELEIQSDAKDEKVQEMLNLMIGRCPVYNMLHLAGVQFHSNYSFKGF